MPRKRIVSNLHQLTVRELLAAPEGDLSDGGGLIPRKRGQSASWVFRFTAATGKRREMGLGVARLGSNAQAGDSATIARTLAHEAREQLQRGTDPIDDRDARRAAAQAVDQAKKTTAKRERATLARVAREYHERVIEPSRSDKHSAQWIASPEHHVPEEIWHAPIDAVTPPMLLAALSSARALAGAEVKVPETLQRVRQRLDAVYEDAIFHGLCATNPDDWDPPGTSRIAPYVPEPPPAPRARSRGRDGWRTEPKRQRPAPPPPTPDPFLATLATRDPFRGYFLQHDD